MMVNFIEELYYGTLNRKTKSEEKAEITAEK